MTLWFPTVVILIVLLTWWLSGYDSGVTGENRRADFVRRALRCGITLLLLALGMANPLLFIAVTVILGVLWASCVAELFARGFHRLVEPPDKRAFDPQQVQRDLDRLAALVRDGHNDAAIQLCRVLQDSGECSTLAIETVLFHIYQDVFADERIRTDPALAEIHRLREQGHFGEAEASLNLLLRKQPDRLAAALLLMRIYAGDYSRPDRAAALLAAVGQRRQVPPAFVAFARRCIEEWGGAVPASGKAVEGIEALLAGGRRGGAPATTVEPDAASVDELLAAGHLATAIELLEKQIGEQPRQFELWLKLAEAHGVHCSDVNRAGKIIEQIEANPAFGPEQIQLARQKLNEWRARCRT